MLTKENIDYFNYQKIENKKFWARLGGKPNFKGKKVLDFGCGHGALSIEIAQSGADKVLGIDLEERNIKFANENLAKNFSSLSKKIDFESKDILKENNLSDFDYIVSKDTFEHTVKLNEVINKIYQIINNEGKVFVGFGPLYNFYNGDHGLTGAKLPWFHLIIPEKFLLRRLNKTRVKKINTIQELGLSKLSYNQYIKIFNDSKFHIDFIKINLSDHPVAPIFNILRRIKFLEEFFTYNIYCILKKP